MCQGISLDEVYGLSANVGFVDESSKRLGFGPFWWAEASFDKVLGSEVLLMRHFDEALFDGRLVR